MQSEWDDFNRSIQETETAVRNMDATIMQAGAHDDQLCELYVKLDGLMELMKLQRKTIENQLAGSQHPQIGSFDRPSPNGQYRITVSWPEKREWNADKVAEIAGAQPAQVPLFIEQAWNVDRKAWDRASEEEREPYLPALTIKPGARKVTVDGTG